MFKQVSYKVNKIFQAVFQIKLYPLKGGEMVLKTRVNASGYTLQSNEGKKRLES
jgi:hypothetical protein